MPTIDYVPIANGGGANVESQAQYLTDLAGGGSLATGFTNGLAKSAQFNKVLRQSSMVTAAVANFISNQLSSDVLDDGNLAALVTAFTSAIQAAIPPASAVWCGTSGGSANAQTLTPSPAITAYSSSRNYVCSFGFTNTNSMTVNISAVGPQTVYKNTPSGLAVLAGGECVAGNIGAFRFDGTHLVLAETDLGTASLQNASLAAPGGTVASVTGAITSGHIAKFTGTAGTVTDGGVLGAAANKGLGNTVADPNATGNLEVMEPYSDVTGASVALAATHNGYFVGRSNAGSAMTDTLPGATAPLAASWAATIRNDDATATITIAAAGGTGATAFVEGLASTTTLVIQPGQNVFLKADSTAGTYQVMRLGAVSPGIPVRQTVLSGDATSGAASFLTTGSALTPAFTATVPLTIAFAAGFGAQGAVDYVARLAAGAPTVAVPNGATSYLFATYASPLSVTWGYSAYVPAYQTSAPPAPSNGQYWFDLSNWTMKSWNGSAWVVSNTVFVGEAVAAGGVITSVVSYAFLGQYASVQSLPSAAALQSVNHNIGCVPLRKNLRLVNVTGELGYAAGDEGMNPLTYQATNAFTGFSPGVTRIAGYFGYHDTIYVPNKSSLTWSAITPGNWNLNYVISRGWGGA